MFKPTLSYGFLLSCALVVPCFLAGYLNAQTVIGGDTIDQSAILDIQDTAKGVLLPRLTTAQREAMVRPAPGLLILNTTRQCLEVNTGSANMPNWKCLTSGIPNISDADTLYWNQKLGASDTLSLSDRIDAKVGLPQTSNNPGNILYWDGATWVRLSPGQNGQVLQLQGGVPTWSGPAFATVSTNPIGDVTATSATVGGNILSDGGASIIARGIVYSTSPNPTLGSAVLTMGSGIGDFSGTLTGLVGGTQYFVRAYATNSAGTVYGNEVNFYAEFIRLLPISAGTFSMGCTPGDSNCQNGESPVHSVMLSAFRIGETEVTQGQWQVVMGSNPSTFSGCTQCPVEQVSWYDALVFCNRLSEQEGLTPCYYADAAFTQVYGKSDGAWSLLNVGVVYWNPAAQGYRLPTESEWEYAARGGSPANIYSGSNDIGEVAWYDGNNSPFGTKPVKGKMANGYGLHDMSGNVWEWCWDWYGDYSADALTDPVGPPAGDGRVFRGGYFSNATWNCRVSVRAGITPSYRNIYLGFRVVR
jgi:formylglycine-generating enzyme required for sulfatase activity